LAADPIQITQGIEAWGVVTTLGIIAIGGYAAWVLRRLSFAVTAQQALINLVFPDGMDKPPAINIGELVESRKNSESVLDAIQKAHEVCIVGQAACLALHKQFVEKPYLTCEKFESCPAIQDARTRSKEANEHLARMEAMLNEFLKNAGVQIMRLAEIAAGVIENERRNDGRGPIKS
jgi:hypothetical protein